MEPEYHPTDEMIFVEQDGSPSFFEVLNAATVDP
jgi:hypothetical protein